MRRKKRTWYHWILGWPQLMLIWLFSGFALGTLVLLFPVRMWTIYVRDNEMSEDIEKTGVIVMMFILVVVSFFLSYLLYKWHLRRKRTSITVASLAIPFAGAVGALMLFMNPGLVNSGSSSAEVSQRFTIGPYPTAGKIEQLKKEGYTGIISLLHPAVVPFEPALLDDEEKASKEYGIELVKAPMLPWIGDNTASLNKIESLVKDGKGKYYVHCYLGKDRVNVVRNLITKITGESAVKSELGATHRSFEIMKSFERGDIFKLGDSIYLTPYPTDEEFLSFFLAGKVRSAVSLLDKASADNKKWIEKEKAELQKSTVQFRHYSLKDAPSLSTVNAVVDSIVRLPKPIVIHRWNTKGNDTRILRMAFKERTGFQPINLATNVTEHY